MHYACLLFFGITVKMADLSSVISRVQSPTCTICVNAISKNQMTVRSPKLDTMLVVSPRSVFQYFKFNGQNSMSLMKLQCVYISVLFSFFQNFLKLWKGGLTSSGEAIVNITWSIWSPILYLNPRNLKRPNSKSLIRYNAFSMA